MDILTPLFQFLSKPIHLVFIGIALIIWAPDEIKWLGYISLTSVAATIFESVYQKIKKRFKDKKEQEENKNNRSKELSHAIKTYNELHPREKYMVDLCIAQNERVYNIGYGDGDKGYITGLHIKGFGQISDFGKEIIFNGKKYTLIKSALEKEIKQEWADRYSREDGDE